VPPILQDLQGSLYESRPPRAHYSERPVTEVHHMRRAALILVVASMLVAACGDDDDDDAEATSAASETAAAPDTTAAPATTASPETTAAPDTTAAPETTAAPATTAESSEDTGTGGAEIPEEQPCAYRSHLLVTTVPLEDVVDPATLGVAPIDSYTKLLDINGTDEDPNFTDADFAALTETLSLYDVGDQDPFEVAAQVDQIGAAAAAAPQLVASPVLATTITGHWTAAPGEPPLDVESFPSEVDASVPDNAASVAIVDTGYTETPQTPAWLADRVDAALANVDTDLAQGDVAGHGKFVASVIVQQSPQTFVRVAAMAPVTPDHFYELDSELVNIFSGGYLADELQFFSAIDRLILFAAETPFDVLNLSVGAWACKGLTSSALVMLDALNRWNLATDGARVVAAAGNHAEEPPTDAVFLPGQLDPALVTGVASLDPTGMQLSGFSNPAACRAIGEGLFGIRRDDMGTYWSGTSFATAVVTGSVAAVRAEERATGNAMQEPCEMTANNRAGAEVVNLSAELDGARQL